MMFKIVYRCKECTEVVRTHERDDLLKDVTVFMPWPCKSCQKSQVLSATNEEFKEGGANATVLIVP
jgi:hypothetical protein